MCGDRFFLPLQNAMRVRSEKNAFLMGYCWLWPEGFLFSDVYAKWYERNDDFLSMENLSEEWVAQRGKRNRRRKDELAVVAPTDEGATTATNTHWQSMEPPSLTSTELKWTVPSMSQPPSDYVLPFRQSYPRTLADPRLSSARNSSIYAYIELS